MANQAEASKSVAYAVTGSASDEIAVSKAVAYIILIPGEGTDDSNRQGHVHSQIFRRR